MNRASDRHTPPLRAYASVVRVTLEMSGRQSPPWARSALLLVLLLSLPACNAAPAEAPAPDVAPSVDARADGLGAAGDAAASDTSEARPPIPNIHEMTGPNPTLFDCTSKGVPQKRLSPTPLTCILTSTCATRLVVGHRGAGGEFANIAPENSLASIRAALWMGQDGVELDVRHTSDDELVVMHDSSVNRTTNGEGSVSEMTLKEVTALKLNGHNESKAVYGGDFTCELVPTLAEAFALTKGRLFVDLDTKTSRIDLVVTAIEQAGVIDEVFVSVPDPKSAAKARALNPKIRVQIRPDSAAELETALKLLPKRPPEVIEVPTAKAAALAPAADKIGAKIFCNGWTADAQQMVFGQQQDTYLKLFSDGCDIVQTEFPAALLQALGRTSAP